LEKLLGHMTPGQVMKAGRRLRGHRVDQHGSVGLKPVSDRLANAPTDPEIQCLPTVIPPPRV
jgi:hypothetical protein